MFRLRLAPAAVLGATLVGLPGARADEDVRMAVPYIQGLRERGYFDLADAYLEKLRTAPNVPAALKATIDYEQGRVMIDEASRTGDLGHRKELLDKARGKLTLFTEKQAGHAQASEALVELARLLVERGHLAMIQSGDADNPRDKEARIAEARASFDQARQAYARADEKLSATFKTFPPHIPDNDPKKAVRDRVQIAMMDAQLQKAVVDYEQGQTYPLGSKERADFLAKGQTQFEDIYKRYRTQIAGLVARMWQAKCYEEKGEIGPALGIYNELLEHQAPQLRGMQRHVAYFKIIAHAKRKEYALAADLANAWLQRHSSSAERLSPEGMGVQLELAKNILAQLPEGTDKETNPAVRRAVEVLSQVVRVSSPSKAEALEILKKYKPRVAASAENLARMGYDELMSQAEQALAQQEWDKAAPALRLAIRKSDPARDPDKANLARYKLAFCYYMGKRFYEADVLSEHLARRYPRFSMSPKATEIAIASLYEAYSTYRDIDRNSDLDRIINVAQYAIATWPEKDEADAARITLGQIDHGLGKYPEAIAVFESVGAKSPRWIESRTRAGASRWEQSQVLRRKGDEKGADAEVGRSLAALNAALKARRDAGAVPTDQGLLDNICDIADVQLRTGKAAQALALLEPAARAVQTQAAAGGRSPGVTRLLSFLLRAHINNGQIDRAQADMATLEKIGGGANLAQLYFGLGKLLESEMKALRDKGDRAGLERRQADYLKFLNALAAAKSGQTYESLQWAGEQMLKIDNPKGAAAIFKRILETADKDKAFLAQAPLKDPLFRTRVRYSESLREQGDYTGSEAIVQDLLKSYPHAVEPLVEQGMLLENRAETKQGSWKAAFAHWQKLALRLSGARPRPIEYYDAWYHAAFCLFRDRQGTKAKQTLGSVMRLSPRVGNPEMKEKYQTLLKQIK